MKIEGDTIIFKSEIPFYLAESRGIKSYTIRLFNDKTEENTFLSNLSIISKIKIVCKQAEEKYIIRDLTNVFFNIQTRIWIFAWRHHV